MATATMVTTIDSAAAVGVVGAVAGSHRAAAAYRK